MAGNLFFARQMKEENEKNKEKEEKIVMISPYEISPNPSQPRKYFTDEAIFRLADSIRNHGLIQPLTVRKTEEGYELIAGERRLRALKMLGYKEAPCILVCADEKNSAVLAITENLQRSDLNIFEEAEAISKLIDKWGVTQSEAALRLGISQSAVANKIRILRLSQKEQDLIVENSLTERHARALVRIKDEQKRLCALKTVIRRKMNVHQCEKFVERTLNGQKECRTKMVFKDLRIFTNTINMAIDTMRRSGVKVEALKGECDEFIEYKIKIPKVKVS